MDVHVTFRHVPPSEALRAAAAERVEHIARLFAHTERASVILTVENHAQSAEILLSGDGSEVVAHATSDDLYRALDEASAKAETQAKKLHEKREARRRT